MMGKQNCKHCGHVVWWDVTEERWKHKHYLHNDNCDCRSPLPKFPFANQGDSK